MSARQAPPAPRRWWLIPLGVFAVSRLVDGAMLWWLGKAQYPESTWDHSYHQPSISTDPVGYGSAVQYWDGQWYRQIVEQGYPDALPRVDGRVVQNAWAFYPGFPGVARTLTGLGLDYALAVSVISLTAGAIAVCLLYRMLLETASRFTAVAGVVCLCTFPAAPVLQTAYTESLALALVLGSLWFLRRQRYVLVLVLAVLLSLVRPIVLPLAAVVAVHGIVRWRREPDLFPTRERVLVAAVAALTAGSFLVWPALTGWLTGEPDAYLLTQRAWADTDGGAWPSWLVMLLSGGIETVVGLVALSVLGVVVARKGARHWGTEGRAWVLFYGLYIFAATRPGSSVFRYAMLAVFPWWPFPEAEDTMSRRGRVGLLVLIATLGTATQYLWIKYYWVPGPAALSWP